jgi:hypothetical protein
VLEAWSDETTFYIWNGAKYTPRAHALFNIVILVFTNGHDRSQTLITILEQEELH